MSTQVSLPPTPLPKQARRIGKNDEYYYDIDADGEQRERLLSLAPSDREMFCLYTEYMFLKCLLELNKTASLDSMLSQMNYTAEDVLNTKLKLRVISNTRGIKECVVFADGEGDDSPVLVSLALMEFFRRIRLHIFEDESEFENAELVELFVYYHGRFKDYVQRIN